MLAVARSTSGSRGLTSEAQRAERRPTPAREVQAYAPRRPLRREADEAGVDLRAIRPLVAREGEGRCPDELPRLGEGGPGCDGLDMTLPPPATDRPVQLDRDVAELTGRFPYSCRSGDCHR